MVGPPKTLQDLRRVEGAVRVTCRACSRVELRDREATIFSRTFQRRSTDWRVYCAEATCAHCSSPDVSVVVMPFAQDSAEVRARRAQMLLVNLAIEILEDAAAHRTEFEFARHGATPAVRLALRVLHTHVRDREMLVTYWKELTIADGKAYNGAQQALRWIVKRLLDRGYPIWAEHR